MKKKLGVNDMLTYFAVIECCEKKILIDEQQLNKCNEITCPGCDRSVAFRGSDGLWYLAGDRIFN